MIVARPGHGVIGLAKILIRDSQPQLHRITLLHHLLCPDAEDWGQRAGREQFGMAPMPLGLFERIRGRKNAAYLKLTTP